MRVLIIGASGHVGTLVTPFLKQQHTLRIYDVKPPADATLDYHPGDVTDFENLKSAMAGMDLLHQGEFLKDGKPLERTGKVANPREFAGYTFGYNSTVFARRVHDVLTMLSHVKQNENASKHIDLVGVNGAGVVALTARALSGDTVQHAAVDTAGFRFGRLDDFHHPDFCIGAAKYDDVPGLVALNSPGSLWIAGETAGSLGFARTFGKTDVKLSSSSGSKAATEAAVWLMGR